MATIDDILDEVKRIREHLQDAGNDLDDLVTAANTLEEERTTAIEQRDDFENAVGEEQGRVAELEQQLADAREEVHQVERDARAELRDAAVTREPWA